MCQCLTNLQVRLIKISCTLTFCHVTTKSYNKQPDLQVFNLLFYLYYSNRTVDPGRNSIFKIPIIQKAATLSVVL